MHVWAIGIFDGRSQIAYARVAGIFHRHGTVVFRPFLGHDGILEAGLLKRLLPVVHTLYEVGPPLFGRSGVDVVDDGLFRFNQFATLHLFAVCAVLGLQSPAGDEPLGLHALLVVGKEVEVIGEVTHTGVEQAAHHGTFGEEYERNVQAQCDLAGQCGCMVVFAGRSPGLDGTHLGIEGEGLDALDIGMARLQRTESELLLGTGVDTKGGIVLQEEAAHRNLERMAFTAFYLERADNRVGIAADDGAVDGLGRVGRVDQQA